MKLDLTVNCLDKVSNGCIMCKLDITDRNKINVVPKGLYTKNTNTCD